LLIAEFFSYINSLVISFIFFAWTEKEFLSFWVSSKHRDTRTLTTEGFNDIKHETWCGKWMRLFALVFLSVVLTGDVCPAPFDKHDFLLLSTIPKLPFV
jgi:hypothetical protein